MPPPLHMKGRKPHMNTGNTEHYYCKHAKHQYNTSHPTEWCFELNPEIKSQFLRIKEQTSINDNNRHGYAPRGRGHKNGYGGMRKTPYQRNKVNQMNTSATTSIPLCVVCSKRHSPGQKCKMLTRAEEYLISSGKHVLPTEIMTPRK